MIRLVVKTLILNLIIAGPAFSKDHEVKMLNYIDGQSMIFEPGFLKINSGDKVTFIPTDSSHNSRSILTPDGVNGWKGNNDEPISITFNQEGVYIYECSNHSIMAMVGIIQVGKPLNIERAKEFIQNYEKRLAMNNNRLSKYFENVR